MNPSENHPKINNKKFLFTSIFGPFGIKDKYSEGPDMQMEFFNTQLTRFQGIHSFRQISCKSYSLHLLAANISTPSTVLDFPTWKEFKKELKKGYSHVGITFVVANVLKVKRMAEYIRKEYPETIIILGGIGTVIPDLEKIVPCDEICHEDGIKWLRNYLNEKIEEPIVHPLFKKPLLQYIYGYKSFPKIGIIVSGVGCDNCCYFCTISHKFKGKYCSFLNSGKEIFDLCLKYEKKNNTIIFAIQDDNFLKNPQRARDLLFEMEKNKKPYNFQIFSSPETIKEIGIDFLVRLGVSGILLGVESQKNSFSKLKDINAKGLISELQNNGISVITSLMLFQEHHNEKTIFEDIDWAIGLGSDFIQFINLTAVPSTPLYNKFKQQGKLRDIPYKLQHGLDEINFNHPCFPNTKEQPSYSINASKKKFLTDGPGLINSAITAIQGYLTASQNFEYRAKNKMSWNPETLSYKKTDNFEEDKFMKMQLARMKLSARRFFPLFLSAKFFASNTATKEKVKEATGLWQKTFGKPKFKDTAESYMLLILAIIEYVKILASKLLGRDTLIRQPPCSRKEYYGMNSRI